MFYVNSFTVIFVKPLTATYIALFEAVFSLTICLAVAQHNDVPILNFTYKALIGFLGYSQQRAQHRTHVNN